MLYRDANPRPRGNISGVGRIVVSSPGEKWTVKILLVKLRSNDLRDFFSSRDERGDSVARDVTWGEVGVFNLFVNLFGLRRSLRYPRFNIF